jgi:hypothetical protein
MLAMTCHVKAEHLFSHIKLVEIDGLLLLTRIYVLQILTVQELFYKDYDIIYYVVSSESL